MDFRRKGIKAFVNCNDSLDMMERVSASVVIFSKSCLSSTSISLDKLAKVLQCRKQTGHLVVPVFYDISPSDVVVQEHESADRIREWRSALQELRELPGHQSREECSERELLKEIVKDVYEKLFPAQQIGINSRLLEIEKLLCKQPWSIRHIGIWGMLGIGKSTLAKAVFDQISGGYEVSCFIKHFDKEFHEKRLHLLLAEHFGKILKELPRVCSSFTRPSLPRDKLRKKRTLVVLDDVYNPLFAESFLGEIHWFGQGSLTIIISRDKQVFRHCQINHVYEVQSLNEDEVLQLVSQCALGRDKRKQKVLEVPLEVIEYANGNPFALRCYGKEPKGRKLSDMETTFIINPHNFLFLFKSNYETLNDNEKNIFLDIACFFNGENVDYVMQLLEGCGFFPHAGIDVLVEKSLVTISENKVKMHRIIQDFGREISNRESIHIEQRRRLWEPLTIKFLLEDNKLEANEKPKATNTHTLGTEDIEGICLDVSNLIFDVKPGLESLPYELRLLHWDNYPLQTLPQDFDPCQLVELNMSYSQLQRLWEGTKNLEMLKRIKSFPEVSPNIEELHLEGTSIRELPISIGNVTNLKELYLTGCSSLVKLPTSLENATNLQKLNLTNCSSLVELPASFGNAIYLLELYLNLFSHLVESSIDYVAPSSNTLARLNNQETDPDGLNTVQMFSRGTTKPLFHSASYRQQANHAAEAINRNITRAKESEPCNENEWVEEDEPGVYITTALAGGARNIKRIRLCRKRFSTKQAEEWWAENQERVYEQYSKPEFPIPVWV